MNSVFVCEWSFSDFETDQDGEEHNTLTVFDFTYHDSLLSAIKAQEPIDREGEPRNRAYLLAQGAKDASQVWLCCTQILEYQDNQLIGKYHLEDGYFQKPEDNWRFYEKMEHWDDYWPYLTQFPPSVPELQNNYDDGDY